MPLCVTRRGSGPALVLTVALALAPWPVRAADSAGARAVERLRLRYLIECLNHARRVELAAPGAADTPHRFRLVHELGGWARFNWPRFEPVAGAETVSLRVRREGDRPESLTVRFLREDGSEWQSAAVPLTETWVEHVLGGKDFRLFRGGDPATAGALSLAEVVQFQVVPSTGGQGQAAFGLDEIRLQPGGPSFTADGDAEVDIVPSREASERERALDLVARWLAEAQRLDRATVQANEWLRQLAGLQRDWAQPGGPATARARLATRSYVWQRQPSWQSAVPTPTPPTLESGARLDALVDRARRRPTTVLLDFEREVTVSMSWLYQAPRQAAPEIAGPPGARFLRHQIAFSAEAGRQTVFTEVRLPQVTDLSGRVLAVRMRCTAAKLNRELPLLLRVRTRAPDGGESWGDLKPEPQPGTDWCEVRFDITQPLRGVRFTPAAAELLAVRLENDPGVPEACELGVAQVRLDWPDAWATACAQLQREQLDLVQKQRLTLYQVRDRIAAVESDLAAMPPLRQAYLASFIQPTPRSVPASVESVLAGSSLPPRPLHPGWFLTATDLAPAAPAASPPGAAPAPGAVLTVRLAATATVTARAALLAELESATGVLVAAGRVELPATPVLHLGVPPAQLWEPEAPTLYRLRCALLDDRQRLLASTERRLGLRQVGLACSGPTPALRHLSASRQPDWHLIWNGQPAFPHGACYHWPDEENTLTAGRRLFADLWLDTFRDYGFALLPQRLDRGDALGLRRYGSFAPAYKALTGWADVAPFAAQYRVACQGVAAVRDRPLLVTAQVGNEVELVAWGAELATAFPGALYQPLDLACELLRRELDPTCPVMYVRAGSFRQVPPLPHEDVCGVNQYTGRYSGRLDEVPRDLAELARQALLADRPMLVTEWNGPRYSWASSGIGGVSDRGCAYSLEQYYRAMIDTPGIVGSSEFTLNWVIAPFEDLTNQPRQQAMKDRPKHTPFGGGHTADHVPLVGPLDAVRGPTFRAMQAFQGPFYVMANRPGEVSIIPSPGTAEAADRIASGLRAVGKVVRGDPAAATGDWRVGNSHVLVLAAPGEPMPVLSELIRAGVIEAAPATAAEDAEPVIQRRIHPTNPDFVLVTLSASTAPAFVRGVERLEASVEALVELAKQEGAMTRVLALTDSGLARYYEGHLIEFVGRGYHFGGDDTRTRLDPAEVMDAAGNRRPAWADLAAVILDCSRSLEPAELALVDRLLGQGVNLVISLSCYQANPEWRTRFPAQPAARHSLGEPLPVDPAVAGPLEVRDLGSADLDAIRTFKPDLLQSPALTVVELQAPGSVPLARTATGAPVAVAWDHGPARVCLMGGAIGAVVQLHWQVTHAGKTHPLYDRDTACGLERVGRFVVNCTRSGAPVPRVRPRLVLRVEPDTTLVRAGQAVSVRAQLTDVEARPVSGQLRARCRLVCDGKPGVAGPYQDLVESGTGEFVLRLSPAAGAAPGTPAILEYPRPSDETAEALLSLQLKAFATGYVPVNGGLSLVLTP